MKTFALNALVIMCSLLMLSMYSYADYQKSVNVVSTAVVADSLPPTVTISTLADGSLTNTATLNIAGKVSDNDGIKSLTINKQPVSIATDGTFTYPVPLTSGANIITTVATDNTGNTTTDTRTITLDKTAPTLVITSPPDNYLTGQGAVSVNGSVSETATVQARVNNGIWQTAQMSGNNFTILLQLSPGLNTIEITASDTAGNSTVTTSKRTATYDTTAPTLAITNPNQDTIIEADSMTLNGTVSDSLSSVTMNINYAGQILKPEVINGGFSQELKFSATKIYPVIVTAVDAVGNTSASVTRNIVHAPFAITISSPTHLNSTNKGGKGVISFTFTGSLTPDDIKSLITTETWITIGTIKIKGNAGTIAYSIAANTGLARSGTIHIGANQITVSQDAVPCKIGSVTVSPANLSASGEAITINVSVIPEVCSWSVASIKAGGEWLTGLTGKTVTGNGSITGLAAQNNSTKARSTVVTIATTDAKAKKTVTVKQVKGIPATVFSISGTVSSGGTGLKGVLLTLSGSGSATTTTGANGSYIFNGLSNGSYTITPSKAGFSFNPPSSTQTVTGQNIANVNFSASSSLAAQIVACPASSTINVAIQDFNFTPANVTVAVNDIVMWTNNGVTTHTVTSGTAPSGNGLYSSGGLAPGASVCVRYTAPGAYPYFCSIHNFMTGTVTVQ